MTMHFYAGLLKCADSSSKFLPAPEILDMQMCACSRMEPFAQRVALARGLKILLEDCQLSAPFTLATTKDTASSFKARCYQTGYLHLFMDLLWAVDTTGTCSGVTHAASPPNPPASNSHPFPSVTPATAFRTKT